MRSFGKTLEALGFVIILTVILLSCGCRSSVGADGTSYPETERWWK